MCGLLSEIIQIIINTHLFSLLEGEGFLEAEEHSVGTCELRAKKENSLSLCVTGISFFLNHPAFFPAVGQSS